MTILLRDFTDALNTQLQTAGITQQIAWPNRVFVPKKGVSYLQVQCAGRARAPLGFGADGVQQWTGLYQVSVYVPRDSGDREQDAIASKVLAAFPRGLNLATPQAITLTVTSSTAAPAEAFGDWSHLPATVNWFAIEP